jgi:hypothetical protein
MTRLYADTSPEAEAVLIELFRQADGWRKLQMVGELYATTKLFALGGLRERFPNASEAELQRRLAALLLGEDLAEQAYGPLITVEVEHGE